MTLLNSMAAVIKLSRYIIYLFVVIAITGPSVCSAANGAPIIVLPAQDAKLSNLRLPALVNGTRVTAKQVDEMVALAVSNGSQNNAELRKNWTTDIIIRTAILQDVQRVRLYDQGNNPFKIQLAAQNTLVDLWFEQYLNSHLITDQIVRGEYERDRLISQDPKNQNEYQLAQIVVGSKEQASHLITKINSGIAFDSIAREYSLDQFSSEQGGLMGWLLLDALAPNVADLILHMSKGDLAQTPISLGGNWCIIRVVSMRAYQLPSYEDLKPKIIQSLIFQAKQRAVDELMKSVKITQEK